MTLVEFLRARLDEERAWLDSNENRTRNGMCDAPGVHLFEPQAYTELDAKRQVIGLAETCMQMAQERSDDSFILGASSAYRDVLSRLALPHVDHPDYDPAW